MAKTINALNAEFVLFQQSVEKKLNSIDADLARYAVSRETVADSLQYLANSNAEIKETLEELRRTKQAGVPLWKKLAGFIPSGKSITVWVLAAIIIFPSLKSCCPISLEQIPQREKSIDVFTPAPVSEEPVKQVVKSTEINTKDVSDLMATFNAQREQAAKTKAELNQYKKDTEAFLAELNVVTTVNEIDDKPLVTKKPENTIGNSIISAFTRKGSQLENQTVDDKGMGDTGKVDTVLEDTSSKSPIDEPVF